MKKLHELGQNFLTDQDIAAQIAAAAGILPGELVWEIGPGAGILTRELLQYHPRLIAFELDRRLIPDLQNNFGERLELIHGDILRQDWNTLTRQNMIKIVSNLPYQITSPLLEKLQLYHQHFPMVVLMLQREFAQRLEAQPGTKAYSAMTVRMRLLFDIEQILDVDRSYFDPVPKVDSSVVRFTPRAIAPQIANPVAFHKILRLGFSSRRKTLKNNLKPIYGADILNRMQSSTGIDLMRRAETLSEAEFIALSDSV